jgi:uncharacterized protein YukE
METNVPYIEKMSAEEARAEIYRLRNRLVENQLQAHKAEKAAFIAGWSRASAESGSEEFARWKAEQVAEGIKASMDAGREP